MTSDTYLHLAWQHEVYVVCGGLIRGSVTARLMTGTANRWAAVQVMLTLPQKQTRPSLRATPCEASLARDVPESGRGPDRWTAAAQPDTTAVPWPRRRKPASVSRPAEAA